MDAPVEGVARVIAIDGLTAWLEPEQVNACGGCLSASTCAAKSGQPSRRLAARRFAMANDFHADVGDRVVVGISERALVRASATAYAIPLVLMLCMSMAGQLLFGSDLAVAIGAVAGLGGGLWLARLRAGRLDAKGQLSPWFLRFASVATEPECEEHE